MGLFDYDLLDYRDTDLFQAGYTDHGERVDALSQLVHRERAEGAGAGCLRKTSKKKFPDQMFKIADSGCYRCDRSFPVRRFRLSEKDVTAKCYGGDISRKRKLLDKQKKGKKRMKMVGEVMIPQSAIFYLC